MTVFDILKAAMFSDTPLSLQNYQPLFEEMKVHAIAALPYNILPNDVPQWRTYCMKEMKRAILVLHAQDELLQLLEANSIPCVILKGAAAAMAYPNPFLRTMGDVDFLVKRGDLEKADILLQESGYLLVHEKEREGHHYVYSRDKISFELHWRIPLVSETDEKRMVFFEEGIVNREWHEISGDRFPVLPTLLNGLVLILHINQHLRTGLGLRQIVDWMMYVHKLSPNGWAELIPLLQANGVEKLARTVTVLCQRYLGLPTIVEDDASLPVNELLSYIMEKGDFGRKAGLEGSMASFAMSSTEKGGFFKRLQTGGMIRWKAAKKHKILRPFAWIYQGFRILGILVKEKKSPKVIFKQVQHGVDQRHLIDALGLHMNRTIRID